MRQARIEAALDRGYGSCVLSEPRIAALTQAALLRFDGERYRLLAWVIMPNYVHVLVQTLPCHPLSSVLQTWKSFTAKEANKLLGRSGVFWQAEYFDRVIRDERHLASAIAYIHANPVKAGLVERAEEWRFGSAAGKAEALPGTPEARPGRAEGPAVGRAGGPRSRRKG